MQPSRRRPVRACVPILAALGLLAGIAACGAPGPSAIAAASPASASPAAPAPSSSVAPPTPVLTMVPAPTVVPGAASELPSAEPPVDPPPATTSTTATDWGTILDAVPDDFPVYPGARPADAPDGPASGAWLTAAGVGTVAPWYRDTLESLGFTTVNLSSALEDGSRVLDTVSDLPECRIRTTFRPAGGSTMITVLYGAGCAGGEG